MRSDSFRPRHEFKILEREMEVENWSGGVDLNPTDKKRGGK